MKHFAIASLCTLAFVACAPVAIDAELTVTQRLTAISLPAGWSSDAQTPNGPVKFTVPETYESMKNDDSNDGAFYVFAEGRECDLAYAQEQVAMNWGDAVPTEYAPAVFELPGGGKGYTWAAFDGVKGDATEPEWIHWCVDVALSGLDIDIAAQRSDAQVKEFLEKDFIRAWTMEASKVY
jgi:hypothetical protein